MKKLGVLMLAILATVNAQQGGIQVGQSRVPAWPTGATEPPAVFADKFFVYWDPFTNEYVISYPEGLGLGDAAKTGKRITFRWEPGFVVEPEIAVAITKDDATGRFIYDYTVKNGPKAKRAIRYFKIVVASHDNTVALEHPRWHGRLGSPEVAEQAALRPQATDPLAEKGMREGLLGPSASKGKFATWGWMKGLNRYDTLQPGMTESGFRLTSAFRPGITSAYSTTGNALRTPGDLPGPVTDQLVAVLTPEMVDKVTIAIGPRFGPGGPQGVVWKANDYLFGIGRLILADRLSANSPFVKELQATLKFIAETMGSGEDGREPTTAAINIKTAPSTQLERELLQAVQLAFQ